MRKKRCSCGHTAPADFDAKLAFDKLSRRVHDLSQLVAQYMSQAALDRPTRNANASLMASAVANIVGGVVTADFPECCLVGNRTAAGGTSWFCSGVLIHKRVVLTAGHCNFGSDPINVVALRTNTMNDLSGADVVAVRRAVAHPGYIASGRSNDIAVLILTTDSQVQPVHVATTANLAAANATTLVGFGNTDVNSTVGFGTKRVVSVPITFLRRAATDNLEQAEATMGFDSHLEFVAGGDGADTCNGDSGGPAYIGAAAARKVAGLTSRAPDNAPHACGDGGIYTRIDANMSFVREVAAGSGITLP